ncbi:hypothetical protein F4810DRAFT_655091, partial [Camillea tinctor]
MINSIHVLPFLFFFSLFSSFLFVIIYYILLKSMFHLINTIGLVLVILNSHNCTKFPADKIILTRLYCHDKIRSDQKSRKN